MQEYRIWECLVCGWIYDESKGAPEDGIAPGTRWEDVPDDWQCPECAVGKEDFEMVEVRQVAAEAPAEAPAQPETIAAAESTAADIDPSIAPVIVLGTGLAGYNFARELRKLDTRTPLIMISADDGAYYSKPQLSTAFQKGRTPNELVNQTAREMAVALSAQILVHTRVQSIDTTAHTISLDSSQQLQYGKLVLALGSDTIEIPTGGGAAGCALRINDLEDFTRFHTASAGARSVLIIGGGLIGCEYANDLVQAGFEVQVIEAQPRILGGLLPERSSALVQQKLADAGVRFSLGTTVESLDYEGTRVRASLANGEQLVVDRVISAVGVRPRIALAQQAGIATARGITTDRNLLTSASDVYALGDCAEVDGHTLCYVAPLLAAARALAQTFAGTPTPVRYDTMPVSIKTTLCPVVVSPPAAGIDGNWHFDRQDAEGVSARFVDADGQLQGFALVGDATDQAAELTAAAPPVMNI